MNIKAEELNLKLSHFNVSHGMHHDNNYSTALDIAKLSCYAMSKQYFRDIVSVQLHECPSSEYEDVIYKWENTNQLLKEGYTGIKTGITPTAGPCLAASTIKEGYNVVVVVLSCCSMDSRWYEVPKLVNWGVKKIIKIA
jgi:serine-type D-Ala-D-Ala carboxypeptidase (penicillin-binding protein 5/6)